MSFGKFSRPAASDFWKPATIESYTVTESSSNDQVKSWSTLHNVYGKPEYFTGSEEVEGGRETAFSRMRFTTHFLSDVIQSKDYRVLLDGVYWDIITVQEKAHRQFMTLILELREGNDQ